MSTDCNVLIAADVARANSYAAAALQKKRARVKIIEAIM